MTQLRRVEWIDSSLQNGQVGSDDYPRPEMIVSVGFLVEQTHTHVTLARDDHKDDEYRGLVCIPMECVRSIHECCWVTTPLPVRAIDATGRGL